MPERFGRGGAPDQRLTLLQTVHGVVQGYATVRDAALLWRYSAQRAGARS